MSQLRPRSFRAGIPRERVAARQLSTLGAGSVLPSKQKYVPTSGNYPLEFAASGTFVGIKPTNTGAPDLALLVSYRPCSAAAVFTQNKFQAAPVVVSRDTLQAVRGEGIQAVVVNSGCANAVTGKKGMEDALSMKKAVDDQLSGKSIVHSDQEQKAKTLVMSTGVIGQRLPISKILSKIPTAYSTISSEHSSWLAAAKAICTTDTFPKLMSRTFQLPSSPEITYHLAGMTKGAGMIHPNMATLLGILCTDAPIASTALRDLLKYAMARSFNRISVDGDTSTNDTVALLANGAGGGPTITASSSSLDYIAFREILTDFSTQLSALVVRDGEGATKFVKIRVIAAPSEAAAHDVASSIARSPLVKTALYGKDANWGRILCAIGYTPSLQYHDGDDDNGIIPDQTSVSFIPPNGNGPELRLLVNGEPEVVDEDRARQILELEDLEILVRLRRANDKDINGEVGYEATYLTCDFSHEYVTINGDYRT